MTTPSADEAALCVASSCGRMQAPGSRLCQSHTLNLGDWIARIADQFALLDAVPSMAMREPDTGGRSGLASQRSVGRLDVMALRDARGRARDEDDPDGNATRGVLEVLGSWATVVREEKSIEPPTEALAYRRQAAPPGPVCDLDAPPCQHHTCWAWTFRTVVYSPATVLSERRVLATHFDWIVAQDWVDELFADMKAIWQQVQRQVAPQATRVHSVGRCPQVTEATECGGRLWADGTASSVTCDKCDRVFGQDELRRLGDHLLRDGLVIVDRATWYTGVPAGTIRRWVSEGKLASEKRGRRMHVNVSDVERVRDARKGAREGSAA